MKNLGPQPLQPGQQDLFPKPQASGVLTSLTTFSIAPPHPEDPLPPPAQKSWHWGQATHPSPSAESASWLPPPRSWPRRSRSPRPPLPLPPAAGQAHAPGSGATMVPHPSPMTRRAGGFPGLHRGGTPGSHGPLPRHSGTRPAPGQGALCRAKE